MTVPRTVGRMPFQRLRPALPILMLECSALPLPPTVGAAREQHAAHFRGRHAQDGVLAFLAHELDAGAGRARDGRALARLQLHGVHERADGDELERKRVARLDVGLGAAHDHVAHAQALRVQDVALLAVHVVEKRDARAAVRVVLDGGNLGGHAVLVALEVDDAVAALVAAALMARGDAAVVVASRLLRLGRKQRLLRLVRRDLGEVRDRLEAPPGLVGLYCLTPMTLFSLLWNPCSHASPYHQGFPLHFRETRWPRPPREACRRDAEFPRVRVYPYTGRRKQELYTPEAPEASNDSPTPRRTQVAHKGVD